jgi:phosphoribosylanthranilate isomerase
MVLVKICGITREADAMAACEAGADLLGYVFHPASRRVVSPETAAPIVRAVRAAHPAVRHVGLFVNEPLSKVLAAVAGSGVGIAQLHGAESGELCHRLVEAGVSVMKALRFGPGAPPADWREFGMCEFLLCDTYDATMAGGTGRSFDRSLLPPDLPLSRVLLAGGLTSATVGRAVCEIRPAGVDVSSAVEAAPGVKSAELVREFIAAARRAG